MAKMADAVTGVYQKVEDTVVGGFNKMADGFVGEGTGMADYNADKESFVFTYSVEQQKKVEKIRNKYLPKEENKMEKLIRLDKQTERPGTTASLVIGIVGTLILGVGMSCIFVWNSNMGVFIAGIVIGIVGLLVAGVAYPVYKKVTEKERAKVADQILALSKELLV